MDLITRKQNFDAVMAHFNDCNLTNKKITEICEEYFKIRELEKVQYEVLYSPRIKAEPIRHGYWETIKNAYGEIEGFIHAECGRTSNSKDNYCPKCGAKMDSAGAKK